MTFSGRRGGGAPDGVGSVISSRQDEQPRADLKPGALGGLEVDAEAQLAVLEEELRDASHFRESLESLIVSTGASRRSATSCPA